LSGDISFLSGDKSFLSDDIFDLKRDISFLSRKFEVFSRLRHWSAAPTLSTAPGSPDQINQNNNQENKMADSLQSLSDSGLIDVANQVIAAMTPDPTTTTYGSTAAVVP
jgi:hypothetical protein